MYVTFDVEKSKVDSTDYTGAQQNLMNTASIGEIQNVNGYVVKDNDEYKEDNNRDCDRVRTKIYAVSLEKYVTEVNGEELENNANDLEYNCNTVSRDGYPIYNSNSEQSNTKYKDPVLLEAGDEVTYTIKLTNTGTDATKYGAIKNLEVTDPWLQQYLDYLSSSNNVKANRTEKTFTYEGEIPLNSSVTFTITYKVTEGAANITDPIENMATVNKAFKNTKGIDVTDSDGDTNNTDKDWIKIKKIAVSLEKYVSAVNGEAIANRSGKAEYLTKSGERYVDNTENDTEWKMNNKTKYNTPVTVKKGDHVTYTITVKNDGQAQVYVDNIIDTLPSYGISNYYKGGYSTASSNYEAIPSDREVYLERTAAKLLKPGETTTVTITVIVNEPTQSVRILTNNAKVTGFKNKNKITVNDTTPYNNEDNDYVQLGTSPKYTQISVEKVWENVDNKTIPNFIEVQLYQNGKSLGSAYKKQLSKDDNWIYLWEKLLKYDENGNEYIYTVSEVNVPEGFIATYSGNEDRIIITNTTTTLPNNISKTVKKEWLYDEGVIDRPTEVKVQLYQNDTKYGSVITLNENNNWTYTWNDLPRYDSNRNEYQYIMQEEIPNNYPYKVEYKKDGNTYIIKNNGPIGNPDVIIGGYVWNDVAFDKTENQYNALKDTEESKIEGIKVYLYRQEIAEAIAETYTNSAGYYGFANSDINIKVVQDPCEQYIKAKKDDNTQRWDENGYYSYYIVFEYDGIKYTVTPDGTTMRNIFATERYDIDSNAREDTIEGKSGLTNRETFNNSINPNSGIEYYTVNKNGNIPQSIHKATKVICASTNLIDLGAKFKGKDASNQAELDTTEKQLKNVGLGLRGRDIFDLELKLDVYNVKVKVNGQQAVYEYDNKVTLRQQDLDPNATITEDMANIVSEKSHQYVDEQEQAIRKQDYKVDTKSYTADQGVSDIEVTYKVTVYNTSNTKGKATKITNYYDSKYTFKKAKDSSGNTLSTSAGTGGTGYKTRIITTPGTMLNQAEQMEIYLVYTLKTPIKDTLSGLTENNPIPTFNMAEITEYYTEKGEEQTEYTRGLIDKDSAPNSANKEQARTTQNQGQNTKTTGGNPTTVGHYFGGYDLTVLKYEDDTYAAPTLYYVLKDENNRSIEGYVFEDKTKMYSDIKSGNGKFEDGEVGIFGATVKLIEVDKDGNIIKERMETTTDADGKYVFNNILPGYYIIEYHYGDTKNTVVLNEHNSKSYNGEDFQATNNTGKAGGEAKEGLYELNDTVDYWYLYNENEKISTAIDDTTRRNAVSANVFGFSNEEMVVLNSLRKGEAIAEEILNDVIGKTQMFATTKKMLINVEKTEIIEDTTGNKEVQRHKFDKYKISNMNFGIAEVPVTTVNLNKRINTFVITDSTKKNVIAKYTRKADKWEIEGDIYVLDEKLDVSIEEQWLQGARLEVTYDVSVDIEVEKNFDSSEPTVATIAGLVDYIDNNLKYNEDLGKNKDYWEVTTYKDVQDDFKASGYNTSGEALGLVDPNGDKHDVVIRAKGDNPILTNKNAVAVATLTLEKTLSSTNATIEEIIQSALNLDEYVYNNTVEITKFNYENTSGSNANEQKDRIRTEGRYIIIPGVQYDTAKAEEIVIHPPTGDSGISTVYYIIAAMSLTVLAVGVFGIKKFVIKK